MIRKISLGSFQFDLSGTRLTPQTLLDLQTRKCADILNFCPTLRTLQHSGFQSTVYVVDGKVTLEFFLFESAFYALPFSNISNSKNTKGEDPFETELTAVLDALRMAPTRIILAVSPAIDRGVLRGAAPRAAQIRDLRSAASENRGTTPMLPGFGGPTSLNIPKVPKYLPTGSGARISANVAGISPGEAHLDRIEVLNMDGHAQLSLPSKMTLIRKIHGPGATQSPQILEAHDHGHRLTFQVIVVDDWVDGCPRKLDLIQLEQT